MIRSLRPGAILVALLIAVALLSFLWTPADPYRIDIAARLAGPSVTHPFGTDQLGRDVAAMLMVGARTSLAVSLLSIGAALLLGVPLGLAAAARPGVVDEVIMRSGDIAFAFPALLIAILLAAIIGPGIASAVLAIMIFNVPVFARVTRGAARGLWTRDFVAAARIAGKGAARISADHILPNILPILLVQATVQMALALVAKSGLSYVGLGVQPPVPSWGRMLSDAQTLLDTTPRLALMPALAIILAVLGFTLLGDELAARLDPHRSRA